MESIELCNGREAASDMMMDKCLITRLFLRKGCDINKAYEYFNLLVTRMRGRKRRKFHGWLEFEKPLWQNESHYIKLWLSFLRDQNIFDEHAYSPNTKLANLRSAIAVFHGLHLEGNFLDPTAVTETVFMLCTLGADVSAAEKFVSMQPLHLIALIPYSPGMAFYVKTLFKILLDFGADPCARDKTGSTVLKIAVNNGWHIQWFEALRECNKLQSFIEQFEAEVLGREEGSLHTTIRTGVDITDLRKPSAQGLSRRIASRGDRLDD